MFTKKIHSRMKIAILIICFIFLIIICKVFYIEVIEYGKINTYAENLWSRNLPIWATYEPDSTFNIVSVSG